MGFALLLQVPLKWHEKPPSVLCEAQQNFSGSVPGVCGCAGCSGALLGGMRTLGGGGEGGDLFHPNAVTERLSDTPQFGGAHRVRLGKHKAPALLP